MSKQGLNHTGNQENSSTGNNTNTNTVSHALYEPLRELESYIKATDAFKHGKKTVLCSGVIDSQKCHVTAALSNDLNKPILFVTSSELKAREVFNDLSYFMPVRYYPAKDIIFYNADVHSADIVRQRFGAINGLLSGENTSIVLSIEALFDTLTDKDIFSNFIYEYEPGDTVKIDDLARTLVFMGYERAAAVEGPGQFAIRGGIMDIYTAIYDNAVRLEFLGDEIDSIRLLDAYSQRSIENIWNVRIFPMRELVYTEKELEQAIANIRREYVNVRVVFEREGRQDELETLDETVGEALEKLKTQKSFSGVDKYMRYFYSDKVTLLDYLPENTLIVFDEPPRISQRAENVADELQQSMQNRITRGYALPSQADTAVSYAEILKRARSFSQLLLTTLTYGLKDFYVHEICAFSVKSSQTVKQRVDLLEDDLTFYKNNDYRTVIFTGGKTKGERLTQELTEKGFSAEYFDSLESKTLKKGVITLTRGSITKGFEYPLVRLAVISGDELFGAERQKRHAKKKKRGAKIESFTDLKVGDYVVHDNHGIGIYRGIEKITVDNVAKDYLKIAYADGGSVYVQTSQMDMIQKYIGGDEGRAKLNKLGGQDWQKAKSRVKSAVKILAKDLVELYAKRQSATGYEFNEDTVWQREFEELFPFDETEDQLLAIEDVKRDMESTKVMDRLICGDVGYGKTEIAIRAAFKAVSDGRQVAYLVPTTILAQQHFNTFTQRMKDYPVNVAMLSRFRTPKEQREIIKGLSSGAVDIVIGTHKLLSDDIKFKNLGLIVVDEEQRFGVTHKEKLKKIRANVDVLTLTATPIPRTLHMSLTGIRDMSVLEEPPQERRPVQTYVMEYNTELIRDAIHRELARNGQVYYLHNRVANISETASKIQKLVPEAVIGYAHGQMSERDLENVMMDFIEGEIDVLVCTTIIETGLDISNVNTMIIADADYMGLSQLYQLRGRVGRSNRIAYAYLMYKKDKALTEISEKRLQTIREFTEFGSGFRIAMRDLEIRGAGNLLGAEQHGHMDIVGYDMYCKLLNEAVNEYKLLAREGGGDGLGESIITEEMFETQIDLPVNAFIPPYYIIDEEQKLEIYKKISAITDHSDYSDIQEEIEDRFGELPSVVQNLLSVALLKSHAHNAGITLISQKLDSVLITFKPDAKVDPAKLSETVKSYKGRLMFTAAANPYLTYKLDDDDGKNQLKGQVYLTNIQTIVKSLV